MLISTREINQACQSAGWGNGPYVFCSTKSAKKMRITRAKTFKGEQKVLTLNGGTWVVPTKVWTE